MYSSLRVSFLLAMLAVATVASLTVLAFAALMTGSQFSRYVQVGRELREMQMQEAVLTYWDYEDVRETVTEPGVDAYLTASNLDGVDTLLLNTEQFGLVSLSLPSGLNLKSDGDTTAVQFIRANDSTLEVIAGDQSIGVLEFNPEVELALAPAQNEFISSVSWGLLAASGLAALVAIGLTLVLSRRVLRPVLALTHAARNMENGDLSQRVRVPARGEIGRLAHAFNAMAEALQRNEDVRRTMVSDIAHELRTPLTNVRGYLEAVQDGVLALDDGIVALLHEETMLLNGLVQDLQELALAEAGKLHFELQPLSLAACIDRTVTMLQPSAQSRCITLVAEVPDDLPLAYADTRRVGQVLRNLISNGIKYTPEAGAVRITSWAQPHAVAVSVSDTGNGIAAEHLPYLFERFYRVDPSRSRNTGGAGLGLAICKQLIETQGGKIEVASTLGKGTTFTFTLPLYRLPGQG